MQVTSGATRVVLLIGGVAIKIARVKILRCAAHAIRGIRNPTWARGMLEQHAGTKSPGGMMQYALSMPFAGIRANRQEYRISRLRPDLPIAPVYGMYLFGLVLVMARGEPVSAQRSAALRKRFPDGDLEKPDHVCDVNGALCYVDYGHPLVPQLFGL